MIEARDAFYAGLDKGEPCHWRDGHLQGRWPLLVGGDEYTETGGREVSAQEELEKVLGKLRRASLMAPLSKAELSDVADEIAAIREGLGKAQGEAVAWMTRESRYRLAHGGNSNGAVPVHGRRSHASSIPLYAAVPPADSAPSLEGIRVSLCAPTASEPFRRLECSIVDIGHADRALVVECKELEKELADSAQVLVDALGFYADEENYKAIGNPFTPLAYWDKGRKARSALAAHKSEVKG